MSPSGPTSADSPAVHAARAALAAPHEVAAYSAPIEPTLMMVPPARSRPRTALVVSTALSRLASRFAWRIGKVLTDDRRETLAALGVDSATLDLVSVIRRAGPPYELTTREIAGRTLITAGAVSQRVVRAERAGLVERAPSQASRRAVCVRLTDAGHALIEATVRQLLDHEAGLVAALTEDERAAAAAILAKLERALSRLPDPAAASPGAAAVALSTRSGGWRSGLARGLVRAALEWVAGRLICRSAPFTTAGS